MSHFHLRPTGWRDVNEGKQLLCYNEIATKMNWYYLKVGLDLSDRSFTGFQCNNRDYNGRRNENDADARYGQSLVYAEYRLLGRDG